MLAFSGEKKGGGREGEGGREGGREGEKRREEREGREKREREERGKKKHFFLKKLLVIAQQVISLLPSLPSLFLSLSPFLSLSL